MTLGERHIYDRMSMRDRALVRVMSKNGIVNPVIALEEARRADLPLSYACAVLEQESSGGHNVFGHDPTTSIPERWKGTTVNALKYRWYKLRRARHGMQGVGPLQLTWYTKQDRADKLGGCHVVRWNMRVGFEDLAALIKARGPHAGVAAYNGSGSAAAAYANRVLSKQSVWHGRFAEVSS